MWPYPRVVEAGGALLVSGVLHQSLVMSDLDEVELILMVLVILLVACVSRVACQSFSMQ